MVKGLRLVLSLFALILFVNIISAAPPGQINPGTNGLSIAGVDFSAIKTVTARTAVANVYNSSDGLPIPNSLAVTCQFQVFDVTNTGALQFSNSTPLRINNTFYFGIPNTVYNHSSEYTRIIQCNSSLYGGFYKSTFIADASGTEITTPKAILYSVFIFMTVLFFLLNIFVINLLPAMNTKDQQGRLIQISWLKYFRYSLFVFEWTLFLIMLYLVGNVAEGYFNERLFSNFFLTMFRLFGYLTAPMIILFFVFIFAKIAEDFKLKNDTAHGMFGGDGI